MIYVSEPSKETEVSKLINNTLISLCPLKKTFSSISLEKRWKQCKCSCCCWSGSGGREPRTRETRNWLHVHDLLWVGGGSTTRTRSTHYRTTTPDKGYCWQGLQWNPANSVPSRTSQRASWKSKFILIGARRIFRCVNFGIRCGTSSKYHIYAYINDSEREWWSLERDVEEDTQILWWGGGIWLENVLRNFDNPTHCQSNFVFSKNSLSEGELYATF
jgi:hypothetical protein